MCITSPPLKCQHNYFNIPQANVKKKMTVNEKKKPTILRRLMDNLVKLWEKFYIEQSADKCLLLSKVDE
jgi:hypothetical protein